MYGELIGVWNSSWREIWSKLSRDLGAPEDLFSELYPELAESLVSVPDAQTLADRSNDPVRAKLAFMRTRSRELAGERSLVQFFERAYEVLKDYGGPTGGPAETYFNLVLAFIEKFSLRYDLRRPFRLCPTLPGIFVSLMHELQVVTSRDPHLATLMNDFEDAVRDLTFETSEGRIKTCIQKQVNLLEAIGQAHPAVISGNSLGDIAGEIGTWPHDAVREAMKKLYGFACNYPGIRHGGTPASARRSIEMRDMVAMSILMAGFTPYLSHVLDVDRVYRGGT